jgi:hypothetical protein
VRNSRHRDKKIPNARGTTGKVIIGGAIKRKGNVIARVIDNTDTRTLDDFVHETVSNKVSLFAQTNIPAIAILAGRSRTKLSAKAKASTLSARFTRTRLKASGR